MHPRGLATILCAQKTTEISPAASTGRCKTAQWHEWCKIALTLKRVRQLEALFTSGRGLLMQTKVRFKKAILAALPAIIGGLYANVAGAAGFQLLEQNASGMGTAYAGSAVVAEDASTVFFNPAGMAYLPKTRNVAFGVDAINPSAKFSGSGSAAPLLQTLSGNNGGDAGDLAFVPHAYFTMPLSDKATFGIGMGAPYGLKTEYDNGWDGRFQAIKSDVKIININPSFSYKVNDAVAL
ncbi:MAG: outer membrane protein transport protein, partial [Proteobacteria bacterium]|nr:outer membrane protein transport protein [Pseudomonadota bacterium]